VKYQETQHDLLVIAGFVLLAFFGCLTFLRVGGIYVSPDETANAYFSQLFAESGALSSFDPLNSDLDGALFPRSAVVLAGRLVPGGFIGLPVVFGFLVAVLGTWSLTFLTPILAAAAVFAWYAIIRRVFDREIGLVSAILLSIHPAWWYYSARSLMPNVPFVAFLIFAGYFLIIRPFRSRRFAYLDFVLSGACVSLALSFRTSEAVWIALAVLAGAIAYGRIRISWSRVVFFVAGLTIAILPIALINQATYGSPFASGYTVSVADVSTEISPAVQESPTAFLSFGTDLSHVFFPFGLSYKDIGKNVLAYGAGLFWWMTLLVVIGFPLAFPARSLARELHPARRAYLAFTLVACAYLAAMYGAWTFFDNPDPMQVTIGNSHIRYWMPVFVLLIPFAAFAIRWLSRRSLTETGRRLTVVSLVLICACLSVRTAFFSSEDSLANAAVGLETSRDVRDRVLALTEPDAVIVVDRADKLFFPYRRVRYPLRDETTYALMPRILLRAPLYYYGITLPPPDLDYLNVEKLKGLGLRIDLVETFGIETLYRMTREEN